MFLPEPDFLSISMLLKLSFFLLQVFCDFFEDSFANSRFLHDSHVDALREVGVFIFQFFCLVLCLKSSRNSERFSRLHDLVVCFDALLLFVCRELEQFCNMFNFSSGYFNSVFQRLLKTLHTLSKAILVLSNTFLLFLDLHQSQCAVDQLLASVV